MDQLKGIWPLPGGAKGYVDTWDKILLHINMYAPSEPEFIDWFKNECNLTGEKTPNGYLRVVEIDLDLLKKMNDKYYLTSKAQDYFKSKNRHIILNILLDKIIGVKDIFFFLGDEKLKLKEVNKKLLDLHGFDWSTEMQTLYRLNWLSSLGYVELNNKRYFLTNDGKTINEKFKGDTILKTNISLKQEQYGSKDQFLIDEKPKNLKFIIPDDIRKGIFSNAIRVFHGPDEVFLDFGREIPDTNEVNIQARIIITAKEASELYNLLKNIAT